MRRRRVVPEPRALVPSRGEVRGRPHAEVLLLVRVVDARELRLLRGDEVRSAEALRAEALRARDLLRHRAGAAAVAARHVPALALARVGKLRRGTARGLHRHVGQALREGRHPGAGQHRPLLQPEIQREVAHVALPVSAPPSNDVERRRGERAGPINLEGCPTTTARCRVFFEFSIIFSVMGQIRLTRRRPPGTPGTWTVPTVRALPAAVPAVIALPAVRAYR